MKIVHIFMGVYSSLEIPMQRKKAFLHLDNCVAMFLLFLDAATQDEDGFTCLRLVQTMPTSTSVTFTTCLGLSQQVWGTPTCTGRPMLGNWTTRHACQRAEPDFLFLISFMPVTSFAINTTKQWMIMAQTITSNNEI